MRHKKQTQINKDNIRKNTNRFDHDYKVRDKLIINKHTAYKYETPHTCPFVVTRCSNNGMINLQCVAMKIKYNIRRIKPYKSDVSVEDINPKNMSVDVNI